MSRQTDLLALNQSTDTPHYTFVLSNDFFGSRTLEYAPGSWDDDEFQFSRDMKSFGVFRKFAGSVLNFYKDGRDYLRNVYEGFGPNADCTLTVTEFTPWRVTKTRFIGKIDFTSYEITELSVNVKVIDGSFTDKILSRSSIEVDILKDVSIDGVDVSAGVLPIQAILSPAIKITKYASFSTGTGSFTATHIIPIVLQTYDWYPETRTPTNNPNSEAGSFFYQAASAYADVKFTAALKVNLNLQTYYHFKIQLLRYNTGSLVGVVNEDEYSIHTADRVVWDYVKDVDLTLSVNDSLVFQMTILSGNPDLFSYFRAFANINYIVSQIDQRYIYGIGYLHAMKGLVQQYTGLTDRVKSDFLTEYPFTDDGKQHGVLTNYKWLRGSQVNQRMPISLDKHVKSIQTEYCLGMGIETISGVEKVVIEPMEHFFNTSMVLDLSDRIDFSTITKKVATELFFNRIVSGYDSFEYGQEGGIFEPNTESKYSTAIKYITNELNLKVPFRADSTGIFLIYDIIEDTTDSDLSENSTIFMLDTINDGGSIQVRTDEGFDWVAGAFNLIKLFNMDMTPARIMYRWGRYIRAFLQKNLTDLVRWQTSEKDSSLITWNIATDGTTIVYENGDIDPKTLKEPLWICETYDLEVPIDTADFDSIEANPYGLFKIGPDTYGFLLDYKAKNENNKSSFKLLRYNNAYASIQTSSIPPVTFGQLYNWPTVADTRSIAPEGWHVPTEAEITTLRTYLGGSTVAGGKMKETGLEKWNTPNTGADNSSGFNGRGAGSRDYSDGSFSGLKDSLFIWASDQHSSVAGHYGGVFNNSAAMSINYNFKSFGLSVRLVKDSTDLTNGQTGTMTGQNGNQYRTICIGTQEWMADNLNEDIFRFYIFGWSTPSFPNGYRIYELGFYISYEGMNYISFEWASGMTIEDIYDQIVADSTYLALNERDLLTITFNGTEMICKVNWLCWFAIGDFSFTTTFENTSDIPLITDPTAWAALTTPARCYYDNDINNA